MDNLVIALQTVLDTLFATIVVHLTCVIYVMGEFFPTAFTNITGAVFVKSTAQTNLSGQATINYDESVLDSLAVPEILAVNVIYWRK